MLKNHFNCPCTGVRYYCLRRPTNHGRIACQWELREGTDTLGDRQFSNVRIVSLCCGFRRVVLQSHYISMESLPFGMSWPSKGHSWRFLAGFMSALQLPWPECVPTTKCISAVNKFSEQMPPRHYSVRRYVWCSPSPFVSCIGLTKGVPKFGITFGQGGCDVDMQSAEECWLQPLDDMLGAGGFVEI